MTGLHVNDQQVDLTRSADLQLLTDPSNIRGQVKVFQMERSIVPKSRMKFFK